MLGNKGVIRFGRQVAFRSFRTAARIEVSHEGTLDIGDEVFINDGVNVYCGSSVTIGSHTKIGDWTSSTTATFTQWLQAKRPWSGP